MELCRQIQELAFVVWYAVEILSADLPEIADFRFRNVGKQ